MALFQFLAAPGLGKRWFISAAMCINQVWISSPRREIGSDSSSLSDVPTSGECVWKRAFYSQISSPFRGCQLEFHSSSGWTAENGKAGKAGLKAERIGQNFLKIGFIHVTSPCGCNHGWETQKFSGFKGPVNNWGKKKKAIYKSPLQRGMVLNPSGWKSSLWERGVGWKWAAPGAEEEISALQNREEWEFQRMKAQFFKGTF